MDLKKLVEKHTLKNALDYKGKANPKAVVRKVLAESPNLKTNIKEVLKLAEKICKEVNSLSLEEIMEKAGKYEYKEKEIKGKALPELPNAGKKIVMRLAPFPSGPLHLGNARMSILNDEYVKKYNGELILVIDDTAGSKEKIPIKEAYNLIPQDLEFLGVKFHKIIYKSDRMELFYRYAERFIKEKWAYVCLCNQEELRENRKKGIECAHRNHSLGENLDLWKKMLAGEFKEGQAVLRLKTSLRDKDPAFRDRVLVRISEINHPRAGKKYRAWPMLEFSWAIDDIELGITHIIRGKDLAMEDKMERFIWDLMGIKGPEILHYGLLQIEGIKMSKTEARKNIENKVYSGWEDPRTWSIQSLKKRGIKPEAIREFVLEFGLSINDIKTPIDSLYSINRRIIDPEANRYFFIEQPFEIELDRPGSAKLPVHPDFTQRGERILKIDEKNRKIFIDKKDLTKFLRLKGLYNIKISGNKGKFVSKEHEDAVKNKWPIVQWLPSNKILKCDIIMPTGKKVSGIIEKGIEKEIGNVVQLERFGFAKIDSIENGKLTSFFAHE